MTALSEGFGFEVLKSLELFRRQRRVDVVNATAYKKGGAIALNSSGAAVKVTGAAGLKIVGWYNDEDFTAVTGQRIDVYSGIVERRNSETDPVTIADLENMVFFEDDQTIARTSAGGTLSPGGILVGFFDSKPFVLMGASGLTQLYAGAISTQAHIPIPLASFTDADGDPLAKFTSESAPSAGFTLADSEAFAIRWNNDGTPGTIITSVPMPQDLDDTGAISFHALCSKSGATVGDATVLTIGAFFQTVGALHDADADAGGDSNAMTGNATAKTVAELIRTIAATDVPAAPCSMTLKVTPKAGTLGTDDLIMHSCWMEYTRKLA